MRISDYEVIRMPRGLRLGMMIVLPLLICAVDSFAAGAFKFPARGGGEVSVVGKDYRVEEGERVNGDVSVVMGDVEILGEVNGDVNVVMGDLRVEGSVHGDINAVWGDVSLGEKAVVNGDVNRVMGGMDRAPGAVVTGQVNSVGAWGGKGVSGKAFGRGEGPFRLIFRIGRFLIFLLILLIAPRGVERVAACVRRQPGQACLVGLGAMLAALPLIIVLVITIIGILLIPIVPFVYLAAGFLGWLGVSQVVGAKVFEIVKKQGVSGFAKALVGVLLLEAALWVLPGLFASFFWFVVQMFGFGAVVLTKFGTADVSLWASPPAAPPQG
ncbi:MAG: polymer-forming cytoskeletal protein [bacterium]